MAIRVLHIFAPNFKHRFGGPIFDWKYGFSHWNNDEIIHLVMDPDTNQIVDSNEAFNFEYSGKQYLASKWTRFVWVFTLFKVIIVNKKKYDILHLHVLWWASLLLGVWASWQNIPAMYQSVLLDSDTPGGIIKERFGKLKVRCLKKFKAILAISDYLASDYLKYGFSNQQVYSLMNSVDLDLFHPLQSENEKKQLRIKFDFPLDAKILLFVGSLIKRKGIDILLQAFIGAYSKTPGLFLLIIGPKNKNENPSIDEALIKELLKQINDHLISDRVFFAGLIQDRQKLAEIYRASDIFIFPSRQEGLPNVVLEAMASGLPVIVSQLPALEKVIRHGENGLYVPIGDPAALEKSIIKVSSDPFLEKKIGAAANNYIMDKHSFGSWQSNLVKIYKKIIDS